VLQGNVDGLLSAFEGQLPHTHVHLRVVDVGFRVAMTRLQAQRGKLDEVRRALPGLAREPQPRLARECRERRCGGGSAPARAAGALREPHPHAAGQPDLHGIVARPLGALSARLGRWEQAEACFVRARAHARDLRAPVLQALADTDWALALRLHSDARERRRGEALRHGVVERARELGLGGLIERLES
jgi:hypothetical protein